MKQGRCFLRYFFLFSMWSFLGGESRWSGWDLRVCEEERGEERRLEWLWEEMGGGRMMNWAGLSEQQYITRKERVSMGCCPS